jgi:hypothetical protein
MATKRSIPYSMFDRESYGLAAKNAKILERVYHKGHAQGWDGKEVLSSLIAEHGTPTMNETQKQALGRVFSIILWGELAAWRISAELADEIEPLEPKMAATSQAFDEARHFYVMHDYLEALGVRPDAIHWGARRLLEKVMNADHLAKKLLGMQLMVEPVALTLFHIVKSLNVEPVLTHLLPYYERDESRHVALGVQYLPAMMSRMSVAERLSLFAFQFELLSYEIATNYWLMRDLEVLGVDARALIEVGKAKQIKAMEAVLESLDVKATYPTLFLDRYADAVTELTLPASANAGNLWTRLRSVSDIIRHGRPPVGDHELVPTITDEQTPLATGGGMRRAA